MKNKIMLITYADSFGKNLKELKEMVDTYFKREIGSIHILPFFPSSGDRGFAPMDYTRVDEKFGDWEDIQALAKDFRCFICECIHTNVCAERAECCRSSGTKQLFTLETGSFNDLS